MPDLVPADTLAALDRAGLASALTPLWEDAGPLVDGLVGRPVVSWEHHLDMAEATITGMDDATRSALLRAHPRLGAPPATLSADSYREQDGDRARAGRVSARLASLNDRYERRFGFPFVEWVAGRPLAALVPVLETRMERDRTTELSAGCAALVAIARDRLSRHRTECP